MSVLLSNNTNLASLHSNDYIRVQLRGAVTHFRPDLWSPTGGGLRRIYLKWLDSNEAWQCALTQPLPCRVHARHWWHLLSEFFRALSDNFEAWLSKLHRQRRALLAWQGDELLGYMGAVGVDQARAGHLALRARSRWDRLPHALVSGALGLARPGQANWLWLLKTVGSFSPPPPGATGLSWNIGPIGYNGSRDAVDAILHEDFPFVCLQDLRLSRRAAAAVKTDLEHRFPMYKIFATTCASTRTDRKGRHYQFCVLTALHRGTFSSAVGERLGCEPPPSRVRRGKSAQPPPFAGRVLALKATLLSGESILLINMYQFTANNAPGQLAIWKALRTHISRRPGTRTILVGDANASYQAQGDEATGPSAQATPRRGYAEPASRAIRTADDSFTAFIKESGGSRAACTDYTWSRHGRAAVLDHAIGWNILFDGDSEARAVPVAGEHDHSQLLLRVDSSLIRPAPFVPPSSSPDRIDPVFFARHVDRWRAACKRRRSGATKLRGWGTEDTDDASDAAASASEGSDSDGEDPELTASLARKSGEELYAIFNQQAQDMRSLALEIQERGRRALRRARERPPERSAAQKKLRDRLQLFQAASRETSVAPKTPISRATRLAFEEVGIHISSPALSQLLRALSPWAAVLQERIQAVKRQISKLAVKQRTVSNRQLISKHRWLFDNAVKGMRRVMNRHGAQVSLTKAKLSTPVGLSWPQQSDGPETDTVPIDAWLTQLRLPDEVTASVGSSCIQLTTSTLSQVAPLLRAGHSAPPPGAAGPATLVYADGPWSGPNLLSAAESFFQKNAYGAFASCPTCLHRGPEPITSTSHRHDDTHEVVVERLLRRGAGPGPHLQATDGVKTLRSASRNGYREAEGQLLGGSTAPCLRPGADGSALASGCQEVRTIEHFCPKCLEFKDFRHNRDEVACTKWMEEAGIFRHHLIPPGATIKGTITGRAFKRFLKRMAARKAAGPDGVPAEILKNAPRPFKRLMKELVDRILTGEYKLGSDALMSQVVLLYKKGDPALFSNYRPIALLNSIYQFVNIVITERTQQLTERHCVLQSGQYGFRWHRGVPMSAQRLQWTLKQARLKGGVLLQVNLDYRNAFNAAGHAQLWAILERLGVPDLDLIKALYEHSDMSILVGERSSGKVSMDRGTAQGSTLSPLLFNLFLNALLRLLEASGIGHGVAGVRDFNHLAFADDLSLLVASTADAETLLGIIKRFEEWSGLSISTQKSFLTGMLFSPGSAISQRTVAAKTHRRKAELSSRRTCLDALAFESDDETESLAYIRSTAPTSKACTECGQGKGPHHFASDDSASCIACSCDWRPDPVHYGQVPLPFVSGRQPTRFLGIHSNLLGDCTEQVALVFEKTVELITFLYSSPLTRRQNLLVMERTFQSTFRFPSGIVPWSWKNITTLERMWLRAYKIVWGLHAGTASDILTRPKDDGGLQVRLPLSVLTCTLWTHLAACTNSDDGLKELTYLEYSEALNKYHCSNLRELQAEVKLHTWDSTIDNRFAHACHVLGLLDIQIHWDPFAPDSIWMTPTEEIADLMVRYGVSLVVAQPTDGSLGRFVCSGRSHDPPGVLLTPAKVDRSDDPKMDPQSPCRNPDSSLLLHLSPPRGQPNAPTIREALTRNWPEARTIEALTGAWEPMLAQQTAHSPDGFHINNIMPTVGSRARARGADSPDCPQERSPDAASVAAAGSPAPWESDDDMVAHLDLDALEAQALGPEDRVCGAEIHLDPDAREAQALTLDAGPPPSQRRTNATISWSWGTLPLRQRRACLKAKQDRDDGEEEEFRDLCNGEQAYQRLLPSLMADGFGSLDTIPRATETRNPKGKQITIATFTIPPLRRGNRFAPVALRCSLARWLNSRSLEDWEALDLGSAAAPRAPTIEPLLRPGVVSVELPPLTNLHMAINHLRGLDDQQEATSWWASWTQGCDPSLPGQSKDRIAEILSEIGSSLNNTSWKADVERTFDSLGPLNPDTNRPRAQRPKPMESTGSADPEQLGRGLIRQVQGFRLLSKPRHRRDRMEFLCEIDAPSVARIRQLLSLTDESLRQTVASGTDNIWLCPEWWPNMPRYRNPEPPDDRVERMSRLEGWWVAGKAVLSLQRCRACAKFRTADILDRHGVCADTPTCRTPTKPLERAEGVLLRTAEAEHLGTEEAGDTILTTAQVRECLRKMESKYIHEATFDFSSLDGDDRFGCHYPLHGLGMTRADQARANPTHWRTGWFDSTSLGFPLLDDEYNRPVHPLLAEYVGKPVRKDNSTPRARVESSIWEWHLQNPAEPSTVAHPATARRPSTRQWEQFAVPKMAGNPCRIPDKDIPGETVKTVLSCCRHAGVVRVLKRSLRHDSDLDDTKVSILANVATGLGPYGRFKIEGARWHLLKTLSAPALGDSFMPTLMSEINWQTKAETKPSFMSYSWPVLRAAQSLFKATSFQGGSMVSAPPFFDSAARGSSIFWGDQSGPMVLCYADLNESELHAVGPTLEGRNDWVVLCPPLKQTSSGPHLLQRVGRRILRASGNASRHRGWWVTGNDGLASHSTDTEAWVAKAALIPEDGIDLVGLLETCISTDDTKEVRAIGDSNAESTYLRGSEAGLLGIWDYNDLLVYAGDGSLGEGLMGAGVYCCFDGRRLAARIGREAEGTSSTRPETGAAWLALHDASDRPQPLVYLSDSEALLTNIDNWVGEGATPCMDTQADGDILRPIILLLHARVAAGLSTIFIKVKSHRGEPCNEMGDRAADLGRTADVIWDRPSGRLRLSWEVPSERFGMADGGVIRRSAGWGSEITRLIRTRDAKRPRGSTSKDNYTRAFLSRPQYSQDLLGAYLADASVKEAATRRLLQSISNQFPCNVLLHRNGDSSTPFCPLCTRHDPKSRQRESFGHIQCWCPTLKKPRTAAHHTIWRELITLIKTHTKAVLDSKDMPVGRWSFPAVTNSAMVQEWTIQDIARHILNDTGAAEQLTQLTVDFLDGLGMDSSPEAVNTFLSKRPDGVAFLKPDNTKRLNDPMPSQVFILEFTRAADTFEGFQERKEKEKTERYKKHLEFINTISEWEAGQLNFTVGMRGQLHSPSFSWNLHLLGVRPKEQELIRKSTVRRTLEVHELMLCCYYSAKHNPCTDWSDLSFMKSKNLSVAKGIFLQHLSPP